MTAFGSKDVGFILMDGYDLAPYMFDAEFNREAMLEDTTVFGNTWEQQGYVGLRSFDFMCSGFFDDGTNASWTALQALSGSERVGCLGIEGNTNGKNFIGMQGPVQAHYKVQAARGTLTKAKADFSGSGAVEDGKILAPLAAISGAGPTNGTAVDHGAQTSAGGAGYLQCTAITYTSLAVKIQDSSDNVSFADLITFTALAAAPGKERKTDSGTVDRYVRHSFSGSGGGTTATIFVGFARY